MLPRLTCALIRPLAPASRGVRATPGNPFPPRILHSGLRRGARSARSAPRPHGVAYSIICSFPGGNALRENARCFVGRKCTPRSYTSRPQPRPCARTLRLRGQEAQNELDLLSAEIFGRANGLCFVGRKRAPRSIVSKRNVLPRQALPEGSGGARTLPQ